MQFCYDYNADRYCEQCGLKIIKQINETENIDELEITDSNDYPQKHYISEISPDSPNHCGNCNKFLEHELSDECKNYVLETAYCELSMYGEIGLIVQQWIDFWEIDINEDENIKAIKAVK